MAAGPVADPQAMNLEAVRQACDLVASQVAVAILAQEDVLVLGGDCTVELGTVAGANAAGGRVGLVYMDFDADLNTPGTSDGAFDWTGVAHLLDIPGCEPSLARLGPTRPMLLPQTASLFWRRGHHSARSRHDQGSRDQGHIARGSFADITAAAARATEWAALFDCVLIHFDADVLFFADFPIAENVRRRNGLKLEQAAFALKQLSACRNGAA